ncbi:hypothetical protein BS50DRAFT_153142 [Corynespora cassiicola Philippines]|uniref:Uncharacterized protein n=1 Tax=Corynespora cassiicola Philippines TaxID=1448308 RepID=A0A2T2N8F7_CORCC|nr:hypothetical protein BS50DRAFT_153142 [Corynespora cassiicola Philippines]
MIDDMIERLATLLQQHTTRACATIGALPLSAAARPVRFLTFTPLLTIITGLIGVLRKTATFFKSMQAYIPPPSRLFSSDSQTVHSTIDLSRVFLLLCSMQNLFLFLLSFVNYYSFTAEWVN